MPQESKKQNKSKEAGISAIDKKDVPEQKNGPKKEAAKTKNKSVTEYNSSFTEQPYSAREAIVPKTQFTTNATKGDANKVYGSSTEYNTSYVGQPYSRVQPVVPKSELDWSTGEFVDDTTTKADYVSYAVEPPVRYRGPEWVKIGGNMEFSTSYNEEFPARPINPVAAIKPNMALRALDAKFKGEPTYTSDYRRWQLPGPPKRFQQIEYQPSTVPFEAHPIYSTEFVPRPIVKAEPYKPVGNIVHLGDYPFSNSTDYQESYKQYPVSPREVHQPEVYKPPRVPLDGLTSNMVDFQPLPLTKVESVRPKCELKNSTAKMDDSTTTKSDYVEWPVEKFRQKWERPKWQRSTEHVEYSTTSAEEFKPYDIQPIKRIRPPSRNRKLEAKLSGITQYNEDYLRWESPQRVKPIIREDYKAPTAPFVGHSTYTATFITHPWEKPQRIKKDNRSNVLPLLSSEAAVEEGAAV